MFLLLLTPLAVVIVGFPTAQGAGQREFGREKYSAAITSYTAAVSLAENDTDRLTALSNRSQCSLNIDAYTEALSDADTELSINASHVKSVSR